jgi:hypothetical protein
MKKWFFVTSLFIILAGASMAVSSNLSNSTSNYPGVSVAYVQNLWNVTANLNEGDFIRVYFTQGADWRQGYFEPDEEFPGFAVLYVGVNVTDPRGNTTMYFCRLGKASSDAEEKPLSLLDVNITRDEGALDPSWYYRKPSNSYYEVGGAVQFNGTYKFVLGNVFPSKEYPPASLDIRKVTFRTDYPYTYLLPLGVLVAGGGVALTWFSFRRKAKPNLYRKTKQ